MQEHLELRDTKSVTFLIIFYIAETNNQDYDM